MEPVTKREVTKEKGLQAIDIGLVAVLLAAGAVLRMIVPPVFGITPNFTIGMYCLAIFLIKPKFLETLGIGLVAALVCNFTTKSLLPYLNFISEPVGAIVAFGLVALPIKLIIKKYSFKPALVAFIGTLASGLVYILVFKFLILFVQVKNNPAFTGLLLVILITAIANSILAQLVYYPIKVALGKKD